MTRQKIVFIFAAAWISAALLSWFVYARTTAPKTEKLARVVAAARPLPAGARLTKNDLRLILVREADLPSGAAVEPAQALGRVLLYPVQTNEPLLVSKLASPSSAEGVFAMIEPGKRAVSVPITDASAAGGLIQPRSHVDVLFTRTGSLREAVTTTLLEDVVVLSIGRMVDPSQPAAPNAPRPSSQVATLMVTPEQAQKLEFAKNLGRISLALRNPTDSASASPAPVNASSLARGALPSPGPGGRDDRLGNLMFGFDPPPRPKPSENKKPPKPHHVVDIFRGDKRVQEVFE
jgi:pilus assembly protein CpaB